MTYAATTTLRTGRADVDVPEVEREDPEVVHKPHWPVRVIQTVFTLLWGNFLRFWVFWTCRGDILRLLQPVLAEGSVHATLPERAQEEAECSVAVLGVYQVDTEAIP